MKLTRPSVSSTPSPNEPKEIKSFKSNLPKPKPRQSISPVWVSPNRYVSLGVKIVAYDLVIASHSSPFPPRLQRKAIVDGLRSSIVDFSDHVQGSSTKEVMDLLLLTQYFDMIRDVGSANHCKTTFVPTSKGPADETRMALLQTGDK